jgi:hypothetical protein
MEPRLTKQFRVYSAVACLFAVVLFFAPLAAAAWNAHAAACCTGDQCPIREHHHSKAPPHTADCEHSGDAMMACTMNCCESSERALLAPLAFVLPTADSLISPARMTGLTAQLHADNFVRWLEVLSPPPRIVNSSL